MDLHPAVRPLEFILGRWRGRGTGRYPTIDSFDYVEEVTFGHAGKPFLSYSQTTADTAGMPLHSECGYLRPGGEGSLELVICQPSGIVEVHTGSLRSQLIELRSTVVAVTPSAKSVDAVTRRVEVVGDRLEYVLSMAAVGLPLQHHLGAVLERA